MAKKRIERKVASRGVQLRLKGLAARVASVETPQLRKEFPVFRAGDSVKVHVRIKEGEKERIQIYEGTVIARRGRAGSKSFIVRKISHGVGVERIFLDSSPKIAKIEVVQEGRVRRSKLYYLRGLEGKAAKIERDIETQASAQARESSSGTGSKT